MSSPARRGVALIIAIAVLAALLLLALPFIFSQSASVAGARAASWDGVARRGSDRAAGLATGLATYATGMHRSPQLVAQLGMVQLSYVQVPLQIQDSTMVNYPSFDDGAHRSVLESVAGWPSLGGVLPKLDTPLATHGAQIEDEARRIDPNCLGPYAWAMVLARAGIKDPHTLVNAYGDLDNDNSTPNPPTTPYNIANEGGFVQVRWGRLANTLARWRPNGSYRYNRLEDLLGADPLEQVVHYDNLSIPPQPPDGEPVHQLVLGEEHPRSRGYDRVNNRLVWYNNPNANTEAEVDFLRTDAESNPGFKRMYSDTLFDPVNGDNLGYRVHPLTTAELERLRPLLTFHVPGQGRSGLIDVATVVAAGDDNQEFYGVTHDDLPPDAHNLGQSLRASGWWGMTIQARTGTQDSSSWQRKDDALAIFATPALNMNTVPGNGAGSELALLFSQNPQADQWPTDPVVNPITSLGRVPRLAWLDPRNGDGANRFERPPLALHGFGVFAIEGAANALDPQGKSVGQRRRRTVVQAVPQERVLEAAWATQGEIEALLLARHGSWMVSGPHPVTRIKDYGVGDTDAMLALDSAGWMAPAPVSSFGQNPAVPFDWHVPFGLTHPTPWGQITHAYVNTRPTRTGNDPTVAPTVQTALASDLRPAAGGAPGRLTPHGLHLKPNERIAWDMGDNGPWRGISSSTAAQPGYLASRHLNMRFQVPTAVPSGAQTVLLEARAQRPGADTHRALLPNTAEAEDGFGVADAVTDDQYVWRVHYDPDGLGGPQLVLVIANAALPWRASDRARFGITDDWKTGSDQGDPAAAADPRTLPDDLPFAPTWQAQRVEFRYLVPGGLSPGRWYHLQVYAASDRPGEHGLILDGIVGRDAIAANAGGGYSPRLGDHYTFPSLRLNTASLETPLPPGTTGNTHLALPQLEVLLPPGFTGVEQILPTRGLIRIDDEFFSYDEATGTTLNRVARARRQNTNQASTEDTDGDDVLDPGEDINANGVLDKATNWRRWPIVQGHRNGALVTPGWSQFRLGARAGAEDPHWYHGAVQLVGPAEDPSQGLTATPPTAPVTAFNDPTDSGRPTSVTIGTPIACPVYTHTVAQPYVLGDRGYVEFWQMIAGQYQPVARCGFTRSGTTLNLDWTDAVLAAGLVWSTGGQTLAIQISIEVDGEIANAAEFRRFSASGLLQLIDRTNGRIEWVRYDASRDLGANGRFFINTGGWTAGSTILHRPGFGRSDTDPPAPLTHTRGALRTAWRTDMQGPWPGRAGPGAPGTVVLPVQTRIDAGDRFESGDVITVVPDLADSTERQAPMQMVVRHACRDGLPAEADSGAQHDTINEYFALTHQVPVPLRTLTGASIVLIGRGWSGDDLSPLPNAAPRRGMMPSLVGLDGPERTPALHVGSGQGLPARPADYLPDAAVDVVIDDLCAGSLRGAVDRNDDAPIGVRAFVIANVEGSTLAAAADLPVTALFTGDVLGNPPTYGLIRIDGEVFAFRRVAGANDRVDLIGRALLGSTRKDHALAAAVQLFDNNGQPGRNIVQTLPAVVLPMGPVGELVSDLPAGAQGTALDIVEIPYGNYYRDPTASGFEDRHQDTFWGAGVPHGQMLGSIGFHLLHEAAATATPAVEVLRLLDYPTQANQDTVAPWLRGLYGTSAQTWTPGFPNPSTNRPTQWIDQSNGNLHVVQLATQQAGQLNPIIIGWWPRFAPPLANDLSDPTDQAAHLRSRSFAWAGFPLRFHGSRFDPANIPALRQVPDAAINPLTKGIADVPIGNAAGLANLDFEVRALAVGEGLSEVFDWDQAPRSAPALGMVAPFNWSRFLMREVDGAEMRVHWRARTTGTGATPFETIADNQGRAPRLGATDTELGHAPAARAGIRLRCVAPARVLAIEEVR